MDFALRDDNGLFIPSTYMLFQGSLLCCLVLHWWIIITGSIIVSCYLWYDIVWITLIIFSKRGKVFSSCVLSLFKEYVFINLSFICNGINTFLSQCGPTLLRYFFLLWPLHRRSWSAFAHGSDLHHFNWKPVLHWMHKCTFAQWKKKKRN